MKIENEVIHYGIGTIESESCLCAICENGKPGDSVSGHFHEVNCPDCIRMEIERSIDMEEK